MRPSADAGHLHTEAQLQQFSRQLADEIEAACRGHKLTLRRSRPACRCPRFRPPISDRFSRRLLTRRLHAVVRRREPRPPGPSEGADWTWKAATRAIPAARNQRAFQADERVAMRQQAPVLRSADRIGWLGLSRLVTGLLGLFWELIRPRRRWRSYTRGGADGSSGGATRSNCRGGRHRRVVVSQRPTTRGMPSRPQICSCCSRPPGAGFSAPMSMTRF